MSLPGLGINPTPPPKPTALQGALDSIGAGSPVTRALVTFSVAAGAMAFAQPGFAYNPDGSPKSFGLEQGQTIFTWYTVPLLAVLAVDYTL